MQSLVTYWLSHFRTTVIMCSLQTTIFLVVIFWQRILLSLLQSFFQLNLVQAFVCLQTDAKGPS